MRLIKMFGLAALAAVASTAFIGASTASAESVLCLSAPDALGMCSNPWASEGEQITGELSGGNAKLKTSIGTVECTTSSTSGTITNPGGGGELVLGEIETLSFGKGGGSCFLGAVSCTVTTTFEGGGTAHAVLLSHDNGNGLLLITPNGTPPGASVLCGKLINCTYSTEHIVLDVDGGTAPKILAVGESLNRAGILCPEESLWTATYAVSPAPLWSALL